MPLEMRLMVPISDTKIAPSIGCIANENGFANEHSWSVPSMLCSASLPANVFTVSDVQTNKKTTNSVTHKTNPLPPYLFVGQRFGFGCCRCR
jgi:hypothetical protein